MKMKFTKLLTAAVLAFCCGVPGQGIADTEPLAVRNITYFIGSKTGGGYDRYGRLVARYLNKKLPETKVIPENRANASGIPALRQVRDHGQDGSKITLFNTGLLLSQLGGMAHMDVNLETYSWIGKASSEARVLMLQKDTGISSFDALLNKSEGLVFVTSNYGNSAFIQTHLLRDAFDLKIKIVAGFGGSESKSALLKGEADGMLTSESNVAQLVENGAALPVLVFGASDLPELEGVASAHDFAATGDQKLVVDAIVAMTQLGRVTVAAPGLDEATLATLRGAYAAALRDPELLAEAEQQRMPIDPLSGEETEAIVKQLLIGSQRLRDMVAATLKN